MGAYSQLNPQHIDDACISASVTANPCTSFCSTLTKALSTLTKALSQAKEEFFLHSCHSSSQKERRRLCAHNSFLDCFVDPLDQVVVFPATCCNTKS